MNELQQVFQSIPTRIQVRFEVTTPNGITPVFKPLAWRPTTQDRWTRFQDQPTVPQTQVDALAESLGRRRDDCPVRGVYPQIAYFFNKAATNE